MRRGVVIGKFLPPHRGHKHLIDVASSEVDELWVIVCEHTDQEISGEQRATWLRRIHPRAHVLVVADKLAADDSESWARYTIESLGFAPDVAFTSEEYGTRYAAFMGCEHVMVDHDRVAVPISGTAVRAEPLRHWEYLEPCVRAFYAKRVVVVGAESTGTTTMALALAGHYQTTWAPEYGRLYTEGRLHTSSSWCTDDFVHIARVQNLLEDSLAESCNRILICDTDSFATSVWHERYMGDASAEVDALCVGRQYDLYLLTDADIPFVQDGLRDGEHIRDWMHGRFEERLKAWNKPYLVLSGSHEQRLRQAVAACDAILA